MQQITQAKTRKSYPSDFLVEADFFARFNGVSDFLAYASTQRKFWESRGYIIFIDGVNLLPLALVDGDGLHCADGFLTRLQTWVFQLPLVIQIAALVPVHPELLRNGMFHGAAILPAHFVVGNPSVMCSGSAVCGEFGLVVDGALRVVVLRPANMPQMPQSMFSPSIVMPVVTMP